LRHLKIHKNLSQNTIKSYGYDLEDFCKFCTQQGINYQQITEADFESYTSFLYKNSISARSTNRKFSAIRGFFEFLNKGETAKLIAGLKTSRKLPVYLTTEEILLLLDKASENHEATGIRTFAVLSLLYYGGVRITECLAIKMQDIQSDEITITGKGGKTRAAFLTEQSARALSKYLLVRPHFLKQTKLNDSPFLFCSKGVKGYYTRENFFVALKKLAHLCEIDERKISPHKIRHSFATHIYNKTGDIRLLQEALGHSDISTTQIYTHVEKTRLTNTINNFHPLANSANFSKS